MSLLRTVVAACLLSMALGAASPVSWTVGSHEFRRSGPLTSALRADVTLALHPRDMAATIERIHCHLNVTYRGEEATQRMCPPLTRDELYGAKHASTKETVDRVTRLLHDAGATHIRLHGSNDAIVANMDTATFNRLFETTAHVFVHSVTGERVGRPTQHGGPVDLAKLAQWRNLAQLIVPGSPFHQMPRALLHHSAQKQPQQGQEVSGKGEYGWSVVGNKRKEGADADSAKKSEYGWSVETIQPGSGPTPVVIPSLLHSLYNVPPSPTNASDNGYNAQAVLSMGPRQFNSVDYEVFMTRLANASLSDMSGAEIIFDDVSLPTGTVECDTEFTEQTLDIEYISALNPYTENQVWVSGDFLQHALLVMKLTDSIFGPWVQSMSYGQTEQSAAQIAGVEYLTRLNYEYSKIVAIGITLVASSGDAGATGYAQVNNDLSAPCDAAVPLSPFIPASSPYVVAVGATMLVDNPNSPGQYEQVTCQTRPAIQNVTSRITSGGGFSLYFRALSYQSAAVSHYTNSSKMPSASLYSPLNRGYPDISVLGNKYQICKSNSANCLECGADDEDTAPNMDENYKNLVDCTGEYVFGTSASAPVFASMISRINGERRLKGQSSLGFIHPYLYAAGADAIVDVTQGNNLADESINYPDPCWNVNNVYKCDACLSQTLPNATCAWCSALGTCMSVQLLSQLCPAPALTSVAECPAKGSCGDIASCDLCHVKAGCGWCATTTTCMSGNATGPTGAGETCPTLAELAGNTNLPLITMTSWAYGTNGCSSCYGATLPTDFYASAARYCVNGFYAASGWDAVTGLGTPDYAGLHALLINASQAPVPPASDPFTGFNYEGLEIALGAIAGVALLIAAVLGVRHVRSANRAKKYGQLASPANVSLLNNSSVA